MTSISTATDTAAIDRQAPTLVAPLWHTVLLVGIFLGLALSGALFQHRAQSTPAMLQQRANLAPLYISLLAMEWGLLLFVRKGLRRNGVTLREVVGGHWSRPRDIVVDITLALGAWGLCQACAFVWRHWLGVAHAAPIDSLLPRGALEGVLWIAVSISAGICEELTFRGYLQRQFTALAHSRWTGLGLQAALFGISHGYQGVEACMRIALIGLVFGVLAIGRRSLRPGMLAHTWTDIAGGLFGI